MKIKEGYLLREVAGNHVVVSLGKVDFDGMIRLNETGVILWKALEQGATEEELGNIMLREYNVTPEIAAKDVAAFVEKLRAASLLDD